VNFELPEVELQELTKIMTPMGFSTPAEIAASVAFIASYESSDTTGSVLSVDRLDHLRVGTRPG